MKPAPLSSQHFIGFEEAYEVVKTVDVCFGTMPFRVEILHDLLHDGDFFSRTYRLASDFRNDVGHIWEQFDTPDEHGACPEDALATALMWIQQYHRARLIAH